MKTDKDRMRMIPRAIEFEESILASCMIDNSLVDQAILMPDDFYSTANQIIYRAMVRLYRSKAPVDAVSVVGYLNEKNEFERIGGALKISKLLDSPPATNFDFYVKKVCEKAALRRTIEICNAVTKRCLDDNGDAEEVLNYFQENANKIQVYGGKGSTINIKDLVLSATDRYDELRKQKGYVTGIPTGFGLLDYYLGGIHPGLIILAARPSMGKTAISLNLQTNAAKKGYGSLMFSLEQGEDELIDRMISAESGVNLMKFRNGMFSEQDWNPMLDAQSKIYEMPIIIDPTAGLRINDIRHRIRKEIHFHPEIKFVVIDYLQLIRGPRSENRNAEIGEITRILKSVSKELKIPIVVLSQLNRELERRPNPHKRPKLSDLRDSGNIEQDADVVIFLYRPAVYSDVEDFEGHTELIISKQRNGPVGTIQLKFNPKHVRFYDIDQRMGKDDKTRTN